LHPLFRAVLRALRAFVVKTEYRIHHEGAKTLST